MKYNSIMDSKEECCTFCNKIIKSGESCHFFFYPADYDEYNGYMCKNCCDEEERE